jgi:hypothetical protein
MHDDLPTYRTYDDATPSFTAHLCLLRTVPWQAAHPGIQSPAAAMGAGPLGSVTLPVWAQPWYALN